MFKVVERTPKATFIRNIEINIYFIDKINQFLNTHMHVDNPRSPIRTFLVDKLVDVACLFRHVCSPSAIEACPI